MKKPLTHLTLIICIASLLFSCINKYDNISKLMSEEIRKDILKKASIGDYKVNILEFKFIKYDVANENNSDSIKLLKLLHKADHFQEIMGLMREERQLELERTGLNSKKALIKEEDKKYKSISDSASHYLLLDSLLRAKISNRKNPKMVYKAKYFMEAILEKNGENQHIKDTVYTYFHKDNLKIDE